MQLRSAVIAALAVLSVTGATRTFAQPAWQPEKNVEIIGPAAAGGGTDRTARVIQRIMQNSKIVAVPVVVTNRPGGGGALRWDYGAQQPAQPHYLVMTQ